MSEATKSNVKEGVPEEAPTTLLYEQDTHISSAIRCGLELGSYRCIPTNPDHGLWDLNERQHEYIRQSGLHRLTEMRWMRIDHALITGLAERWRPETNTFHFPIGEVTVTLEDVAYIYGLPINGPPVTGRTFPNDNVADVCEELLGIRPLDGLDFNGISIKFTWLDHHFRPERDDGKSKKKKKKKISEQEEIYATRAYLFFLVSGQILAHGSGSRGPAYLLELFREFKPYAWAPACLANLYRMLTKGVKWSGIKNTEGGEAAIRAGLDPTDESDAFEHTFKTMSGPLQLLQVWAYSRMAIGRSVNPSRYGNENVRFPLMVTWRNRLEGISHLTKLRRVRKQLNNLASGEFEWQPYKKLGKTFLRSVPKADRDLFTSSAPLIFYWLLERHNTERVMKQFGLRQVVPPPFVLPFPRVERKQRVIVDYRKKYTMEINMWEDRWRYITRGKKSSNVAQSDEYMAWYSLNTIMLVGRIRGEEGQQPIEKENTVEQEPSIPQKRVTDFIDHIERSCDRALRDEGTDLGKFISSLQGKLKRFRVAFGTTFDDYVESCNSSQSELDKQLVVTPKKMSVKRPASKSPVKKKRKGKTGTLTEASPTRLPTSADSESKLEPKVHVQQESPLKSTYQPGESSVHGYVESINSQHDDDPNLAPHEDIFSTSPYPYVLVTPTPIVPLAVVPAPSPATIESLVWRLKHLPRKRRVPGRLLDFEHRVPHSEYVLSDLDKEILEGFHIYYTTRKDELGLICSLVDCDTLNALLDPDTLLDTNVIYYYFEYLRRTCGDAYLADPSLCSFWQKKHKAGDDCAFGVNGVRVWDAKESKTLVYILHQHNHFTLLVGYTDESRWEFYNSSESDKYGLAVCEGFKLWLTQRFYDYGWTEPWLWSLDVKANIPRQQNGSDCGVFACAFAENCIFRRPVRFTQADMPYFRRRILIEIFKRSWELNGNRLHLPDLW